VIVHDVEQGTQEWHSLRAGLPTASEFSKLVTSDGSRSDSFMDYAYTLAAEKYAGEELDGFAGNKFTVRGHEMEELARSDYEMRSQVVTEEVGFCTNNLMQYGCSPDSLVGKDGGLEIKSKIAKEHLKALFYYEQNGVILPQYFAQPQGCMLVTNRKWWDINFYHPKLPQLTVRQYPDKPFLKALRRELKAVIVQRNLILEKIKAM